MIKKIFLFLKIFLLLHRNKTKSMKNTLYLVLIALLLFFSNCKNEFKELDEQAASVKKDAEMLKTVKNTQEINKDADFFVDNSKAYTYKAKSYIFIRLPGPFGLGHAGVGFEYRKYSGSTLVEVRYYYGAIEGYNNQSYIKPGNYNGGWWAYASTGQNMYSVMKSYTYGYTGVKYTTSFFDVTSTQVNNAINVIKNFPYRGYNVSGNNCMNASYDVLRALGTPNLQWPSTNWFPKDWYNNHKKGWSASISPIP